MHNPLKSLTRREWMIWLISLAIVTISNLAPGNVDLLALTATWIGVTALILAAKGNVWAQILITVFSILYAVISWKFRYWGEMITYRGMTLPMAVWSTITWLRNPSESGKEVAIRRLTRRHVALLLVSGAVVTALTMLRSSYYALGYAANDLVLILLWLLASIENPAYLPVLVNFVIFFLNDMYGFFSWRKREAVQFAPECGA